MIKNYLLIGLRNLRKNPAYSTINILGLSVGLAVTILIGLWIYDEISFNQVHEKHERLAQMMTTQTFNGEKGTGPAVSLPIAPALRTAYPGDFKHLAQTSWNFGHIIAVGDKKLNTHGMWVQQPFPEMISLHMIKGNAGSLNNPSSILITQSLAKALFGEGEALGQTVKIDNRTDYKVSGVFKDLPNNSTFFDSKIFLSWEAYLKSENWVKESADQWGNHSWQLFAEMQPGVSMATVTNKIRFLPRKHVKEGEEEILLHPMDKWHLHSEFKNGKVAGGRIQFVWLFGTIGVFVLLLACINFMNLSTARSEKRAREVGVRKAIGSMRTQLIYQFLTESILVAWFALFLSVLLVLAALPFFNGIAKKEITIPWGQPYFWLSALAVTLITGIVAGSYPAFYLSGFQPVKVLKGTFKAGRLAAIPRQVLVVLQFTVSITLIIGTIIVFRQIQFAKDRPVGYSRDGLFTVMISTPELWGHYNSLRDDLLKTGVVADMAESSSPSTGIWSNQIGFEWKGKDPNSVPLFGIVACTHDYGNTHRWKIKEGRDFSREFVTDSGGLILNEAAVKLTGLKQVVGETIKWNDKERKVIGVVKDMVMESPYEPVKPTIFFLDYNWTSVITIRVKPEVPMRKALAAIEPVFRKADPGSPFKYEFTDEEYANKFSDEERIGNLATFFAILAVFISCLGLFGLASFVAEQKTKEIGVRKVLGASVFNLWQAMSTGFLKLVIISCLIAIPIAWYFLSGWLQQYQYRTTISMWVFFLAALGAVLISLVTVSFHSVRAALANPVKSLRTE
ncbi:ABC transporter permease [Flavihumibacter petaseus]|uniref:Putative ABC transporter permease protein n=1 Tax=Flavihumibacter petaseus NBRC 106054 TaxID=1220578 RepID=A0A0E9MTI2_9BACT|nr:ABC transporter permease [Flavihumibacter petaseus]GAO41072.1 putative ABC transporter permease protein [Flavihumibacter petaseus NBRC 106054]